MNFPPWDDLLKTSQPLRNRLFTLGMANLLFTNVGYRYLCLQPKQQQTCLARISNFCQSCQFNASLKAFSAALKFRASENVSRVLLANITRQIFSKKCRSHSYLGLASCPTAATPAVAQPLEPRPELSTTDAAGAATSSFEIRSSVAMTARSSRRQRRSTSACLASPKVR